MAVYTNQVADQLRSIGSGLSLSAAGVLSNSLFGSSLTAGRVPFVGVGGVLTDNASLAFNNTTKQLSLTGTVNDVIAVVATNSSTGNQASTRFRAVNSANIGDFAVYGTGHGTTGFANRLSINAYDALDAAQIMVGKSNGFFRVSIGTDSLSTNANANERFRASTTEFRIGDNNGGFLTVATATGATRIAGETRIDDDLGIGGAPTSGYALHIQKASPLLVVDQTTAGAGGSAQIVAQANSGSTTVDFRMYDASEAGTLAGVNKASAAYSYAVGASRFVVGGHTGVPLLLAAGGAVAITIDTSGNVGVAGAPHASGGKLQVITSGAAEATAISTGVGFASMGENQTYILARDTSANSEIFIGAAGASGYMGMVTNHPLDIRTNNVTAFVIDTDQLLNLGSPSAAANNAQTVTVGNVGPGGAGVSIQSWFKIKDSSGNTRYIPLFG